MRELLTQPWRVEWPGTSTTAATPTVSRRPWSWPTPTSSSSLPGGSTEERSCLMTTRYTFGVQILANSLQLFIFSLTLRTTTKYPVLVEQRIAESGWISEMISTHLFYTFAPKSSLLPVYYLYIYNELFCYKTLPSNQSYMNQCDLYPFVKWNVVINM